MLIIVSVIVSIIEEKAMVMVMFLVMVMVITCLKGHLTSLSESSRVVYYKIVSRSHIELSAYQTIKTENYNVVQ